MNNIATGIEMGMDDIVENENYGKNNYDNEDKIPKYYKMEVGQSYFVRLVSGILPYYSHYQGPNKPSLISPSTLHITQVVKDPNSPDPNAKKTQYIYHKEDGSFYTDEEAHDPLMDDPNRQPPQKRYATNIIDLDEVKANPNGPWNVYIMTGGKSVFEHFFRFRDQHRNYPCFDLDRGAAWKITKTEKKIKGGKTRIEYFVEPYPDANIVLPPDLRVQLEKTKSEPGDTGAWSLLQECHPFKCSRKNAIDNGYNPIFQETEGGEDSNGQYQQQQQQQPYNVNAGSNGNGQQFQQQAAPQTMPQPPQQPQFQQQPQQPVPPQQPQFQQPAPPAPQQQQQPQYQQPQQPQAAPPPQQQYTQAPPQYTQAPPMQPQQSAPIQAPSAASQPIEAAPIGAIAQQSQPVMPQVGQQPASPQEQGIDWAAKLGNLD